MGDFCSVAFDGFHRFKGTGFGVLFYLTFLLVYCIYIGQKVLHFLRQGQPTTLVTIGIIVLFAFFKFFQ